jgi:HSP20 family protein
MTETKEREQTDTAMRPYTEAPPRLSGEVYTPRADIVETDEAFWVRADLPGVKPADVSLSCKDGNLFVQAHCAPRRHGKRALWCEYGVGDYFRSFTIGEQIDDAKIEAVMNDGVLTIRLPKTEEAKPRRIAVKAG